MVKKKYGIVSSFDQLCGNATYSEALANGIADYADIIKIDVPYDLRNARDRELEQQILSRVRACDVVNIQMELGLYGPAPSIATNLICKIINETKSVSVTMHRVEPKSKNLLREIYNQIKQGKISSILSKTFRNIVNRSVYKSYEKIINKTIAKNGVFIVHTFREKKRILSISNKAKILVHPIIWPYNLELENIDKLANRFSNGRKTLGLFGFISEYKNFKQVIQIADFEKYNVIVAGGTHPGSDQYGKDRSSQKKKSEIEQISKIMLNNHRKKSPNFPIMYHYTSPSDSILVSLMTIPDLIIIPYLETGQSGSGIASLAIQYGKRAIFSDTNLIRELVPFLNKTPYLFDVNSNASLADAISDSLNFDDEKEIQFEKYSFTTNIQTYLNSLDIEME